MKKILRRIFGFRQATPANKLVAQRKPDAKRDSLDNPATIEDGSDNAMRRQLVQVLLRDVLRRHGIPPTWIECQMLLVSSRSRGSGMYVRLVIRHWDDQLLNYAFAFQNVLLAEIARFEPKASEWLHGISWQFEMAETCPHTTLPDKSFWLARATKQALAHATFPAVTAHPAIAAVPAFLATQPALVSKAAEAAPAALAAQTTPATPQSAQSDAMQDLERLLAVRDRELSRQAAEGHLPVGYEKTLPLPL